MFQTCVTALFAFIKKSVSKVTFGTATWTLKSVTVCVLVEIVDNIVVMTFEFAVSRVS